MALLREFEKNVEVVVEILEHWLEVIEQQFINEDLGISQTIEGVTLKTCLGKCLSSLLTQSFDVSHCC